MSYIYELNNIESLCRICLTQSRNMIPLNLSLENNKRDPLIIEALEEVVGNKVICAIGYPEVICPMCLGLLKISYSLKTQYLNSEKMLLQQFKKTVDPNMSHNSSENCDQDQKTDNLAEEPSPVQIVIGANKYNLNDILIVEEEKQEHDDFKGFLNNLGKTVTAKFVKKSNNLTKSLHEEEPVVLIEKLKSRENIKETVINTDAKCLDQYIIIRDNDLYQNHVHNHTININDLDLENLTDADQELFQSALKLQLKCNNCDKLYSSGTRFRKHLESCKKMQYQVIEDKNGELVKTAILKCHSCPRMFKQKKFLNYHVKTAHSTSIHKCDICSEIFRNKNMLMYHKLRKHGERKFVCDLCDKKFFTSHSLKAHVLNHTHRNVAQCVCPVCGKTFHYKGGLFYHMKLHTNDRKYCCEFCDKKFYNLNAKKRHTLTHTGVRPYACKYCEKRFFSTGEVRKHEYLHTGDRPYSCKYCNKGFCSSYNMKVHLFSHPGPYACKVCDRTFVNMNVLQFHHKTKHSFLEDVEDS